MKSKRFFIVLLAILGFGILLLSTGPDFAYGKPAKEEEKAPDVDYYSQDNFFGNLGKGFMIWKGGHKYSNESLEKIKEIGNDAREGWRNGEGGYFSLTKLTLLTVLFWLWVATSGWINNDAQHQVDLHRVEWNFSSILVFPIAFIATLFIPIFWIGFPVLCLAWFLPVMIYVHHRNKGLLDADKVMTPDHLWFLARRMMFMNVEPKEPPYESGAPIQLLAGGKKVPEETRNGRTIVARNHPGFHYFKEMIWQAHRRNATMIRVEALPSQTNFSFFIDGVWIPMADIFGPRRRGFSPEEGLQLVNAIKVIGGANPEEHSRRQGGEFIVRLDKKRKLDAVFYVQGKAGGEEAMIQLSSESLPFLSLEELGMTPQRKESFKAIINAKKGLCVLSAAPGQGLRTFTNVAFNVADRFTRDFVTVEDVQKPYMVIENIPRVTYDSAKKETPMTVLPDVFFKEPKVLLMRDMINLPTMKLCCEEVNNERLIITTFRGADSADTIMKMLRTGINPKLLADSLIAVVTQRLIRRLCPHCKEEVQSHPEILRRLGLNPKTTPVLYRKRVRPVVEPGQKDTYVPCSHCMEIGYWGRAGVYDVITMTDEIRQIISTTPSAEAIRRAAAKSGNRGFFTDGAQLVGMGVTSFDEFRRFMQGGQPAGK